MFERTGTGVALESDGTVRVVELKAAFRKRCASRMESFPPSGADLFSSWEEGVKRARELGFDVDGSTVGISDALTYRKTLRFPFKSRNRIMQILLPELEGEIPVSTEAVVADFLPGRPADKGVEGIVFACLRENVSRILEMFSGGTRLRGIQPLSVAFAGFCRALGLQNGAGVFCSEGEALFVRIQSSLVGYVRRFSSPGEEGGGDPVSQLAEEVFQSIPETDGLVLACSGPEASMIMERQEEKGIRQLDFNAPSQSSGVPSLAGDKALFAIASGLALRGIGSRHSMALDLRQGSFSPMRAYKALKKPALRTALLGVLVFLFFVGNLGMKTQRAKALYEGYSDRIAAEFSELFPEARRIQGQEVAETRNKLEELKKKSSQLSGLTGTGALLVLSRLSAAVPAEVPLKIDELSYDSKRLRIEGTVTSFDSVDRIKSALEEDPFFIEVQVQNARVGADPNKVTFRLETEVR
ncbi:MAG: PilN domain-containing protein [Proteobacteria bacterium]|nr:PilN domain-containing protein [Pseudomonadota bacterium]